MKIRTLGPCTIFLVFMGVKQAVASGLLAKLAELDGAGEQKAQEVLAQNVRRIVEQHAYQDWEPELPIRHAGQHSDLLNQLVDYLNVSQALTQFLPAIIVISKPLHA